MPFVAAKCPQCGGDLQLDNEIDKGFCMHCGSKIVVQEAIRSVRIDNTQMIQNWMKMGDLAAESGNQSEAYEYYTKVVEVQPDHWLAVFNKGKAAGWQSTLANVRFTEATTCFGQAINLAPENEKEKLKNDSAEEVKNLALALISIRADRFIKWPDENEASGFLGDIKTILDAVSQLNKKCGFAVTGFMEPIAAIINTSVVAAWSGTILPAYYGNENRPGKYEFDQFIERIGFCTILIENSINLSSEDDIDDIQRYEHLILLHNAAINSCSWDYEISDWGKSWHKEYQLVYDAKQKRNNLISEYNTKISQIKSKILKQDEAKRQEEERKARQDAQKRINDYWSANASEKAHLEREKNELTDQIMSLKNESDTITAPILIQNNNIQTQIAKFRDEQKALGLFQPKEKKLLQAKIDYGQKYLDANTSIINAAQNPIIAKIEVIKKRINEIENELTKAR